MNLFTRFNTNNGSPVLDTQSLVSGLSGSIGFRLRGFIIGSIGTLTSGSSPIYGNNAIYAMYHDEDTNIVTFEVAGLQSNSGWSNMAVSTTNFTRTSAVYVQSGGNTYWQWTAANPFGGNGSTRTITFT